MRVCSYNLVYLDYDVILSQYQCVPFSRGRDFICPYIRPKWRNLSIALEDATNDLVLCDQVGSFAHPASVDLTSVGSTGLGFDGMYGGSSGMGSVSYFENLVAELGLFEFKDLFPANTVLDNSWDQMELLPRFGVDRSEAHKCRDSCPGDTRLVYDVTDNTNREVWFPYDGGLLRNLVEDPALDPEFLYDRFDGSVVYLCGCGWNPSSSLYNVKISRKTLVADLEGAGIELRGILFDQLEQPIVAHPIIKFLHALNSKLGYVAHQT